MPDRSVTVLWYRIAPDDYEEDGVGLGTFSERIAVASAPSVYRLCRLLNRNSLDRTDL
jgi:hypothetical protein